MTDKIKVKGYSVVFSKEWESEDSEEFYLGKFDSDKEAEIYAERLYDYLNDDLKVFPEDYEIDGSLSISEPFIKTNLFSADMPEDVTGYDLRYSIEKFGEDLDEEGY